VRVVLSCRHGTGVVDATVRTPQAPIPGSDLDSKSGMPYEIVIDRTFMAESCVGG
jgi:hypothetical protein